VEPTTEYATVKTIHIMFDIPENSVRKLIAKRKVNVYRLGRSVRLKISEMRALLKRGLMPALEPNVIYDPKIQKQKYS